MKPFVIFASCLAITTVAGQGAFIRPSLRGNSVGGRGNPGAFGNNGGGFGQGVFGINSGFGGGQFSNGGGLGGGNGVGGGADSSGGRIGQQAGGQNDGGGFGGGSGLGGQISGGSGNGAGQQAGGRILRFVSVHVAPENNTPREPRVIRAGGGGPPDTHVNFIFVKAPTGDSDQQTEVVLPEPPKQRTLVYVLLKKPAEGEASVKLRAPAPTQPSKPQVYFIQYKPDGTAAGAGGAIGGASLNDAETGSRGSGNNGFGASGGLGSGFGESSGLGNGFGRFSPEENVLG